MKHPAVTEVALERSFGTVRPDVSARIRGQLVAIEVQLSVLSLETIARRTSEYARLGIYLLWLAQWSPYLDAERYSPRLWERWVHAAYFGHAYYWAQGLSVVPYRFEPFFTRTTSCWSFKGGFNNVDGFYTRKSKRHRSPVRERTLHLIEDFSGTDRKAWKSGAFKIPDAKLYLKRN